MNILKKMELNKKVRKEIEQYTVKIGRPNLLFKKKGIRLYGFEVYNVCYLIDRTDNWLVPTVTIFDNEDEGIHRAMQYVNYKIMKLQSKSKNR
ncbi:MAG: hypothetical protein RSE41_02820 [Clostridia bacterium]